MSEIYNPNQHLREVSLWASSWKLDLDPRLLPHTGRIVPGKAAIFLYKTDSGVGFLENLICNKEATKQDVSEAIDSCVSDIEKDAKLMGIRLIICSTSISSVINKALSFGYTQTENMVRLHKELI